jgi:CheY-like chemotaxis protein
MVELPELLGLSAIRHQLRALLNARIARIITHPERKLLLQSMMTEVKTWVQDGCLIQVTGQFLLGDFGKTAQSTAAYLMNHRLVHFVASDAHDCTRRPPDLSSAYENVRRRWGKATAQVLFVHNAQRPDVVFLDLNIPRVTGWEALRAMKADDSLYDIPVVVFTTSSRRSDKERHMPSVHSISLRSHRHSPDSLWRLRPSIVSS